MNPNQGIKGCLSPGTCLLRLEKLYTGALILSIVHHPNHFQLLTFPELRGKFDLTAARQTNTQFRRALQRSPNAGEHQINRVLAVGFHPILTALRR